jgi:hypothetical protein
VILVVLLQRGEHFLVAGQPVHRFAIELRVLVLDLHVIAFDAPACNAPRDHDGVTAFRQLALLLRRQGDYRHQHQQERRFHLPPPPVIVP